MEWSTDIVLQLIDAYRARPELWDRTHKYFKLPRRKNIAWLDLSLMFNCDIDELKKKMNSLLASFRRERQKMNAYGPDSGRKSSWFAFRSFNFLYDKYNVACLNDDANFDPESNAFVDTTDAQTEPSSFESFIKIEPAVVESIFPDVGKREDEENDVAAADADDDDDAPIERTVARPPPKAARRSVDVASSSRGFHARQKVFARYRDECSVYGEHVANKLRRLDHRTRSIVQHAINNVLFDADMGKYADPKIETVSTSIVVQR